MGTGRTWVVFNLVAFYAGWLACVWGASRGNGLVGPLVVALIVTLHLAWTSDRRHAVRLIAVALAIGVVADGALGAGGAIEYEAANLPAPLPPVWALALWALFATTFDGCLKWLAGRPVLACALGVIGGPLSYWTGQRLGAVRLADRWVDLLLVGLTWGVVMAVLAILAKETPAPRT